MSKYPLLFIPLILAFLSTDPATIYFISWLGMFFLFFVSIGGIIKPLPHDLGVFEQAMRPLLITHIIFAGYMGVSSIFYFLDLMGFYFLEYDPYKLTDEKTLILAAECQRYYLTGHTFYVLGLLLFMNYDFKPRYKILVDSISGFALRISIYFTVITFVVSFIPGLNQVAVIISQLSTVAAVISLAYALPEAKTLPIAISGFIFAANYINAIRSGWKEAIIVPLILLGVYLYPNYKKLVLFSAPVILGVYFYFVPAYNNIVRSASWSGEMSGEEAAKVAFETVTSGEEDLADDNWAFLTIRLSEMSMFIKYVQDVPEFNPYYGFKIVTQALESILPRVFFPDKPITEELVMERVIASGIVSARSVVSAKPPPIVDGYLSGGILGIIITCFLLGAFASYMSVTAEKLFGSYLIGSGLIYTGLFQMLWRGNCFEFMFNSLFWSFIIMQVLFKVGRSLKIIRKLEDQDE